MLRYVKILLLPLVLFSIDIFPMKVNKKMETAVKIGDLAAIDNETKDLPQLIYVWQESPQEWRDAIVVLLVQKGANPQSLSEALIDAVDFAELTAVQKLMSYGVRPTAAIIRRAEHNQKTAFNNSERELFGQIIAELRK